MDACIEINAQLLLDCTVNTMLIDATCMLDDMLASSVLLRECKYSTGYREELPWSKDRLAQVVLGTNITIPLSKSTL